MQLPLFSTPSGAASGPVPAAANGAASVVAHTVASGREGVTFAAAMRDQSSRRVACAVAGISMFLTPPSFARGQYRRVCWGTAPSMACEVGALVNRGAYRGA